MADIKDIITADSYHGDENLGGGVVAPFKIDTKPLDMLSAYTFEYNKKKYEDEQKKAEDQIKELNDLTTYDLNSPIKKDRDYLQSQWQDLYGWVQNNLRNGVNVMDYQKNPALNLEYKKRKGDLENDITGGKTRSTLYAVRQKEVTDETDPDLKALYQKKLDEEANTTDIRTPIQHTNQFDLAPVKVTAAPFRKIEVTDVGRNLIGTRDYSLVDMDAVTNQSVALTSGLMKLNLDENSPAFKMLPPDVQNQYKQQYEAQVAAGKLEPIESSKNFNDALKSLQDVKNPDGQTFKYKNPDGTLNVDALINSGNPIVSGVLEQVKVFNNKMDEMTNLVDNGAFKDNFGKQLSFGRQGDGGLNKSSYSKINIDDGISPEELLKMRILASSKPNETTTKVVVTKLGLEYDKLSLDTWKAHEEIADKKKRTGAYVGYMAAHLHSLKTEEDQDKYLSSLWKTNLTQQPNITQPIDPKNPNKFFYLGIQNNSSIPLLSIGANGKVSQIVPYESKPIYAGGADKKGVPNVKGDKIVGWEGGYYKPVFIRDGRPISHQDLLNDYQEYKKKAAAAKQPFVGGFDDWIKGAVDAGAYNVNLEGRNGTVTEQNFNAAQRVISNQNTKKGQQGVYDFNPSPDLGDNTSETTSSSTKEVIHEDQNQ